MRKILRNSQPNLVKIKNIGVQARKYFSYKKKRETYYLPVNYITVNVRFFKEFQCFFDNFSNKKACKPELKYFTATSDQYFRSSLQ